MSDLNKHILAQLNQGGDRPWLIADNKHLTYNNALKRVAGLANTLLAYDAAPQNRILLCLADDVALTLSYFACILAGCTAVVVDPNASAQEFADLTNATQPTMCIAAPERQSYLPPSVAAALKLFLPDTGPQRLSLKDRLLRKKIDSGSPQTLTLQRCFASSESPSAWPNSNEQALAHILFTSGTTSGPKGVCLTHKNLSSHMATLARHYGYDANSKILNGMPLHHTDGLTQGTLLTTWAGATTVRPPKFSIAAIPVWLDIIYRERITHFYTTPTVLALLLRVAQQERDAFKTPDFRYVISSAGFLHAQLWQDFEATFGVPVVNVYGLTETVSGSLYCGPDQATRRVGTLGKAIDCDILIADDYGKATAAGQTGELWLAGDHVTPGYLDPAQTAEAFMGRWFKTGDLVREQDGFIYLVGRKKNVIIRGGATISPEEITRAVRSMPGVADSETIGIEDTIWGERIVCCVLAQSGAGLSAAAIIDYCRERLAPEKIPSDVAFFSSFPRGPAGKVILPKLRELAIKQLAQGKIAANLDNVAANVLAVAAGAFRQHKNKLNLTSRPTDTRGWDSLGHMELVTGLEAHYDIRLSPRDILSIASLADAVDIVQRHLGQKAL